MEPHSCQVKHNPPHSYGDCVRACIATIINRDDVPHIFDSGFSDPPAAWRRLREYLKGLKLCFFLMATEENPFHFMGENNPDVPYMLMCSTAEGNHAVVCLGTEIYHDPAWSRMKITGPTKDGYYVIGIIGALS